jgi:hypothetical protein
MIHRLALAGAPQGLEVAVAEGAERVRHGLSAREMDRLLEALLPGRAVARLADGRPVVRGGDEAHLSVGHAAGMTAVAVAPVAVGIDIEWIDPALDPLAIDPELFGARDFAFLAAQAEPVRRQHFYRLWTLKEARLKRCGRSLATDRLPDIAGNDDAGLRTAWLEAGGRCYCVGVCWDAAAVPSAALASANCLQA